MTVGITRALCRHLKVDITVAGVVSTRVFDTVAPRVAATPLITVQSFHAEQARSQDRASGLEFNRVQINAYETTAKLAKDLADLVITAIELTRGTLGSSPNNIADVRSVVLIEDSQDVIPPSGGSDVPDSYVHRMEFETWHVPA